MIKIFITFYHAWYHIVSHLVISYHTLSPRLEAKPFHVSNYKTSSQSPNFLSHLITPYHILSSRLEAKLFSFGNCKIRYQAPIFLSYLIRPCHILSHLITAYPLGWKENHLMLAIFKLAPRPQLSYHILSRLVTPYHT